MNKYLKWRYAAKIIRSIVVNYLLVAAAIIMIQVVDASINVYDITYWILEISLMWIILYKPSSVFFVGFLIWKIWQTHTQYKEEQLMCRVMEEYLEGKKSWESLMEFVVEGDCRKAFRAIVKRREYRSYKSFVDKYRLNKLRYSFGIEPDKQKTNPLLLEYVYDNCILATNNLRVQEMLWSDDKKLDPEEIRFGIAKEWLILSKSDMILGKAGFCDFSQINEDSNRTHAYIRLNDDIINLAGIDKRELMNVLIYHFIEPIGNRELGLDSLFITRDTDEYDDLFESAGFIEVRDKYFYLYD